MSAREEEEEVAGFSEHEELAQSANVNFIGEQYLSNYFSLWETYLIPDAAGNKLSLV
jgi:type VI protein secretion system component VasA